MIQQKNFDPCQSVRALAERLYRRGMLRQAIALSRRIDAAQITAWRAEGAIRPETGEEELPACRSVGPDNA